MLLILAFSIIDYRDGDTVELFIDIAMVTIFLLSAVGIFKLKADRLVYCTGINLLNLAILYNVSIGAGGMVALFWLFLSPSLIFFFMLPICSHCKKIRDDKGYWNQLEAYMREHADIRFSHGICPECREKLYPAPKTGEETGEVGNPLKDDSGISELINSLDFFNR